MAPKIKRKKTKPDRDEGDVDAQALFREQRTKALEAQDIPEFDLDEELLDDEWLDDRWSAEDEY